MQIFLIAGRKWQAIWSKQAIYTIVYHAQMFGIWATIGMHCFNRAFSPTAQRAILVIEKSRVDDE